MAARRDRPSAEAGTPAWVTSFEFAEWDELPDTPSASFRRQWAAEVGTKEPLLEAWGLRRQLVARTRWRAARAAWLTEHRTEENPNHV